MLIGARDVDVLRDDVAGLTLMIRKLRAEGTPPDTPVLDAACQVLADRERKLAEAESTGS